MNLTRRNSAHASGCSSLTRGDPSATGLSAEQCDGRVSGDGVFFEQTGSRRRVAVETLRNRHRIAPVNTPHEAFADPQLVARGMVTEDFHPAAGTFKRIATPVHFSTERADSAPAPL